MINIEVYTESTVECKYITEVVPRIGETIMVKKRWFKVYDVIYQISDKNNNDERNLIDVGLTVVEIKK